MRNVFLVICLFSSILSYSQSGNYFLSHYSPGKDRLDNVCFQIEQHSNGMMYYATRSGIMQFDGKTWNSIQGNGAIYTIQISADGTIFWGGANGFGKLRYDDYGVAHLEIISKEVGDIYQSLATTGAVYFLNDEKLYLLNTSNDEIITVPATELTGFFSGVFEISGKIYVSTAKNGTYEIKEKEQVRPTLGLDQSLPIIFSTSFGERTLLALSNQQLYLVDRNQKVKLLPVEEQEYLKRSVIVSGTWLSDDLVVIGTLRGGLVFLNPVNGKTLEVINYAKGLPDNEVFALFSDKSQSVWAAHEYGFTRIAPYLPFRSFTHYGGLNGNVLCAISVSNVVYVGTSLGLFKLEKEETYEEITYFVDIPVNDRRRQKEDKKQTVTETETDSKPLGVESKRRGFLGIFKKKTENIEKPVLPSKSPETGVTETKSKSKVRTTQVKKTDRILRTSTYVYKKVKGIEAKVTQLVEVDGTLIAGGLGGSYEVKGLNARLLTDSPTRYIYASRDNHLYVSTYSDEVKVLSKEGSQWKKQDLLDNLNDQITYIFEGNRNELWLCALDKIYRLKKDDREFKDIQVIEIDNPNYDEFVGIPYGENCILVNSLGFYPFDNKSKSFIKSDTLVTSKLTNYFARKNEIWYKDAHGWKVFGESGDTRTLGLLNLFQNLRFLAPDKNSGDLWIVTGNNELFKYFTEWITTAPSNYPLMLKNTRNGLLSFKKNQVHLKLEQDNSSVTIEVVQPDYLASAAIEYRYLLDGLEKNWTEWSAANSEIEIPYLPAGDYSLLVEARDIFGSIKSMPVMNLSVVPPYWQRPWFYALEVVLFAFLVILSFRLSTRYRIISRLLMLLTIIMLIQFIETIVGQSFETKTSPVFDFFVQVIIAMLILPVEGYLRDLMLRSLESKNRFYRFIHPKSAGNERENPLG